MQYNAASIILLCLEESLRWCRTSDLLLSSMRFPEIELFQSGTEGANGCFEERFALITTFTYPLVTHLHLLSFLHCKIPALSLLVCRLKYFTRCRDDAIFFTVPPTEPNTCTIVTHAQNSQTLDPPKNFLLTGMAIEFNSNSNFTVADRSSVLTCSDSTFDKTVIIQYGGQRVEVTSYLCRFVTTTSAP